MDTKQTYDNAFIEVFQATPEELPAMAYQQAKNWDSVGHMQLIARLEESFDIMFDAEDIVGFSTYEQGREILRKYGIDK